MMSPLARIALRIRYLRRRLQLSQRQLARRVGCSQPYLCQVERGVRPISRRVAEACAELLGVRFRRVHRPRGRPPQPVEVTGLLPVPNVIHLPDQKPAYPRPDRDRRPRDILWDVEARLGVEAGWAAERLRQERGADERFWRLWNSLRFDSWSEKWLLLQVALTGAPLFNLRLDRSGCRFQVTNGLSGKTEAQRAHPAFLLRHRGATVVWLTQLCVRTPSGHRWPDNTLIVVRDRKSATVVVEVDGKAFHQDPGKLRERDLDLEIPVLHLCASRVGGSETLTEVLDWAVAAHEGGPREGQETAPPTLLKISRARL